MNRAVQVAWGSVAVSIVAVALKLAAWWLTGSVALYSDALETVVNVAAAVGAVLAVGISVQPPDAQHPYGHQKAEYFSAVVEGALILAAAGAIARQIYEQFAAPAALSFSPIGIGASALATALNLGWARLLLLQGRRWRSPAIVAGGAHLMSDVWTSCAVLAGFLLVPVTGWPHLDLVLAGLVAGYIVWTGYTVLRDSVGALMDQAVDPATLAQIRAAVSANAEGAIEAHDLRTRHAGRVTFIEFHLVVSADMPVGEAHAICDRLEAALRAEVGEALITIHVEPDGKAKHKGVVVVS